jgi:2,3-bisphosphoglycerate-independent phosphoglycerate mutase
MNPHFVQDLIVPATTKIALVVMDGLGGLPLDAGGKTELETARTPNLDALAKESALGLTVPAGPGITVGSGPGHLALFGYDPLEYEIGRGALEALGVGFELGPNDVAARGNFCSVDKSGIITDRRAGRIATEVACDLIEILQTIKVDGAEFLIRPVKEHRFALVMRGTGLEDQLSETDPQKIGVTPLPVCPTSPGAEHSAQVINEFIEQARIVLAGKQPANMIMLRGFARLPRIATFEERYGLHSAAIALHGMYRGVARLAGMEVLSVEGDTIADEFAALEKHWQDFDFMYLHIKKTDTCGEQGDFVGKVQAIEEVDSLIPRLMALEPDVVIVGGDHSSPALLKSHSWHPVPFLVYGKYVRPDGIAEFGERVCARGSLGVMPATHIMPLALANAGRITKYGA